MNKTSKYTINHKKTAQSYSFSDIAHTYPMIQSQQKDRDGIVQYIIATPLYKKPELNEKIKKLKEMLISLISIVTHYIRTNTFYHEEDNLYNNGLNAWLEATQKLPLVACSSIEKKEFTHKVKGMTITKDLLQLMMSTILCQPNDALHSLLQFLQEQNQAIQLGLKKNNNQYSTTVISCEIEAHNFMQDIIFYPKICFYHILFNRKNAKVMLNCNSSENFEISLEYAAFTAIFNYEALNDEKISALFNQFIQRRLLNSIDESEQFFNASTHSA